MPEWLPALLTFAGVALLALGTLAGAILTFRATAAANRNAAVATQQNGENSLIDQLQEELRTYREDAGRRATIQDERLNALERTRDGYRDYAHELRSHIFDRKEPPPPEWPAGLPR